jgi:phosphate transport system permease protein
MVVLALLLLSGMIGLIVVKGLSHFWPEDLYQITTTSNDRFLGEAAEWQRVRPPQEAEGADAMEVERTKYKIGSRDVYGLDFRWFDDTAVVLRERPAEALALERTNEGEMFGYLAAVHTDAGEIGGSRPELFDELLRHSADAKETAAQISDRESQIARLYGPLNDLERKLAAARLPHNRATTAGAQRIARLEAEADSVRARIEPRVRTLHEEIAARQELDRRRFATIELADGRTREIQLSHIARAWRPNQMSLGQKIAHYFSGLWTFVSERPREANTGGGIFPAIYGTVLMVLLMTLAVVPLGVVAALYLHEYAGDTWFVRVVRLAVNNLAGVPSIVFGVFGLGFFIYFVGAGIDRAFFSEYLPSPTFGTGGILWASLTLALLTVPVVIVATEEGLAAVPRAYREGSLALGATRFQTIRKIIIPHATPGILTGLILAVSRGAGEVAPLMLTGVVPLVSDYPISSAFPFLHLERKFMHLGFHIYDVGFQSPNVEAVKPLVYSTTLVLIVLVVLLNTVAIILRNRLRARSKGASV